VSVKTWQIFYREMDREGNITFRGTRPLKVLFKEDQARNKFAALKKSAAINQAYEMLTVSATGEIESVEFTRE
jgi:hypothetical protein